MSKKECFINEIVKLINDLHEGTKVEDYLTGDALDYWNALVMGGGEKDKSQFTANGKLVLGFMQENKDTYNNLFKAKDIGEGLGISSRTASGAMRKLVGDGFVEKVGSDPIIYSLTQEGVSTSFED